MVFYLTAEIPTYTPSVITAGLNAQWKLTHKDYLYSASWVWTVYLIGNGTQYTITGTDNGDDYHLFTKLASETSSYIAGQYSYTIVAVNGTSKVPMESSIITIKPNFILATGGLETRSDTKIILDNLTNVIKQLSKATTTEVTIDGTSYKRSSLNELIKTRSFYASLYQQELNAEKISQGFADPNKIYTRFAKR